MSSSFAAFAPWAPYPSSRPRRLRAAPWRRALVAETRLGPEDLIWPIFVMEGEGREDPVESLPGVSRLTLDRALVRVEEAARLGIPCVTLFPYVDPSLKSLECAEAWNPENLVCRVIRALKRELPEIGVMTDVALDPYSLHGHDGILRDGRIANDESVTALVRQAMAQAEAGADVIGPSDMMDGRIGALRAALEAGGHQDTLIMSYTAKYASAFYGPFRDAVGSGGNLGKGEDVPKDKKTYQMNPANGDEALKEAALDLSEGADMLMVKPGLPYLDLCRRLKDAFGAPTFAYQVSGEYAMIQAAARNGWIDGERAMMETLISFRRAGCDGVLTYFAVEAAKRLRAGAP
ncbi:porphobilinogen synthase [Neomegalonema sp.]|uniref:porphobilinogen synthase n=1 Tax=Neomegalonema sp. TaxID=2039713 RepID=UPI0026396EE9|nr:porphobilinogen synthase [Neomegalonema sp.]MDD2868610.1 porphobilinogen synthase [Neomegalonema sp.]